MGRCCGRTAAFSLTELLVVMSILIILMALTIPVMGKIRSKSEAARCMGNLRNIMTAESLYSLDNDNSLVPYQKWRGEKPSDGIAYWTQLLHPYITQKPNSVYSSTKGDDWWLRCPSQRSKDSQGRLLPGLGPVYAIGNSQNPQNPHYLHGANQIPTKKRTQISNPAKTPSWMDVQGASLDGGYPAYCRGCYPSGGISNAAYGITDGNNFTDRHSGGSNVGFVDGHVEWVAIEKLREIPTPNGPDFWKHY